MDCLFCSIVSGDIPAEIIYQNGSVLAFRDINPQAPTHILVIPKKHIKSMNEASPEDEACLGKLMLAAKEIAKQENLSEDGYRFVVNTELHGGQTVYHIHLHLLGGRQMTWPPG